jgi:sec-independent protein translocase protein TatB
MLPEIGGLELLVIAAVALIVVGPKDLPVMLRKLGQFTARLRSMAADFRSSFDEMARQSELDELRKEVEAMRQSAATEASNADVNRVFSEIGDSLEGSGVQFNPPMSHQYPSESEAEPVAEPAKPRARRPAKPKVEIGAAEPAPTKPAAKPKAAKPKAAKKAPAKPKAIKAGAKA